MENILNAIGKIIVSASIAAVSFLGFRAAPPAAPSVGASAPQFVAAKPAFLYGGGIGSVDTSIKLTALVTPNGTPIATGQLIGGPSGVFYATIEPATTKKETVSCSGVTQNGDGTALMTGCTRGLQFTAPYTASSTLALSHSGGSSVVISNSPQVYNDIVSDAVSLTRTNVITGSNIFSSTTPPKYDADPVWGNFPSQTLADLSYVNSVATSGAANASETVKGISQLATALQAGSGTSVGSTGARLSLPNSLATTTCQASANSVIISSSTTGKIDSRCIDQTANYTFTGIVNLVPPGSVEAYASTTAPSGWLLADGTSYATSSQPNLFALIGYTYGGTAANFNVPNMKGRFLYGFGSSTTPTIGAVGGAASTTLTAGNIPAVNILLGTSGTFGNTPVGTSNGAGGQTGNTVGSSTPVTTLPPYLVLTYIIKS